MKPISDFPKKLQRALEPFLARDEHIVMSIETFRGLQGKTPNFYALISDRSVFLVEMGAEASPAKVVRVFRQDLLKVLFAPTKYGVLLVFLQKEASANSDPVKAEFPKANRTDVNKFCEELWKSVEVEVVHPDPQAASTSAIASAIDLATIVQRPEKKSTTSEAPKNQPATEHRERVPDSKMEPVAGPETSSLGESGQKPTLDRRQNMVIFFATLFAPVAALLFWFLFRFPREEE